MRILRTLAATLAVSAILLSAGASVTTYDAAGTVIGQSRERSMSRTLYVDGGQVSLFTIEHGKATGPGYDCVYGYQLKVVDYELVSERYTGPGCA